MSYEVTITIRCDKSESIGRDMWSFPVVARDLKDSLRLEGDKICEFGANSCRIDGNSKVATFYMRADDVHLHQFIPGFATAEELSGLAASNPGCIAQSIQAELIRKIER